MKLWAGRLTGEVDARVNALNASIGFDSRMIEQDIKGSMAHAQMLATCGIIPADEGAALQTGLHALLAGLQAGEIEIDRTAEDVHTFVEGWLTAHIGDAGKRLHTARSRNDQVATDLRLYLADEIDVLVGGIKKLGETICAVAEKHTETVMPGYTHMQRAQPVTLAHYLMAYTAMLLRDADRLHDCKKRTLVLPLGAGALAGTTYPIDRQQVCDALGFNTVCENSIDGVSDRDFVLELASGLSILMIHLSRLCEEIILWCTSEFGFMTLSDRFSTGSSIMPQKKNPDVAELVRGKSGRVIGALHTLLTMMKGLPLAYNKDMQEDKEAIFDAVDTAALCLELVAPMLETATFHRETMRAAAAKGYINATDCADYLVTKGMPFRDAYRIAGELVNRCIETGEVLESLPLEVYQVYSPLFAADVYAAIDLVGCVTRRKSYGGPAPDAVTVQIKNAQQALADL